MSDKLVMNIQCIDLILEPGHDHRVLLLKKCREPGINREPAVYHCVKVVTFANFRHTIDISTQI